MTQEQAQKEASQEMAKYQDETRLGVSNDFDVWKDRVFAFHSPSSLKCDPTRFFPLMKQTGHYTLAELGILIPAMENKSMRQLEMDAIEYERYQLYIFELALKFKTAIEKEGTHLQRKYEALMSRSSEAISPKKKTLNFPTAKGDA